MVIGFTTTCVFRNNRPPAEVSKIPYISNVKANNLFQGKYFVSNLKRFYLKTFNIEIEL
jgi:hypothetical protein